MIPPLWRGGTQQGKQNILEFVDALSGSILRVLLSFAISKMAMLTAAGLVKLSTYLSLWGVNLARNRRHIYFN